ncbi:MAG: hypothetical protein ACJ74H_13985 [Thermoanaerobaculia bacterium]
MIAFAEDFSAELEKVSFHTPVWLADTPANHTAAEEAWQRAIEWPHISVTLFRPQEDWRALLDQIAMQRREVDAIDVIGGGLSENAREALAAAGFERFEDTATGFRARR